MAYSNTSPASAPDSEEEEDEEEEDEEEREARMYMPTIPVTVAPRSWRRTASHLLAVQRKKLTRP
jgi:hypothetical protein